MIQDLKFIAIAGLFVFVSFVGVAEVGATGVAASPARLEIAGVYGKTTTKTVWVTNPSSQVALFEVYPDDFNESVRIMPSSFVLESGETREISVQIKPADEGRFATLLSVSARPLRAPDFNAAAGIKIPLTFSVGPHNKFFAALLSAVPRGLSFRRALGIILFFGFVIIGAVLKFRRRIFCNPHVGK